MEILIGLAMIYSVIHFLIIQHSTAYAVRTGWEKVVTWFAISSIILTFLNVMMIGAGY